MLDTALNESIITLIKQLQNEIRIFFDMVPEQELMQDVNTLYDLGIYIHETLIVFMAEGIENAGVVLAFIDEVNGFYKDLISLKAKNLFNEKVGAFIFYLDKKYFAYSSKAFPRTFFESCIKTVPAKDSKVVHQKNKQRIFKI